MRRVGFYHRLNVHTEKAERLPLTLHHASEIHAWLNEDGQLTLVEALALCNRWNRASSGFRFWIEEE